MLRMIPNDSTKGKPAEDALRESEERLALAFRASHEGIWDWNIETDAVWYSPRYKEMLGYSDGEIEPHVSSWKSLLHPEDRARVLAMVDSVLHGTTEYEMEFRLRHKDGCYRHILSRGFPIRREPHGPVIRIVGTHLDLTERKEAEEALRQSEERHRALANYLQNILRSSLDMIISVDRDRRIVEFNRTAETRFGYSAGEIIGQPVQILYADPDQARKVSEIIQANGQFSGEVLNRARNGLTFVSYLESSELHDEHGRVIGVMGISRDITELKQAEAERDSILLTLKKSHEDLLAMLNRLRQAIIITDTEGRITFASRKCEQLLGCSPNGLSGRSWIEACPFETDDKASLQAMAARPPEQRTKVPVAIRDPQNRRLTTEVEILEDPRDPERKIFFIYDLTEVHDLRRQLHEKRGFHGLVGKSRSMQLVYEQITDLAAADATVLIEGETGTGKECVARALYRAGNRCDEPFLPVNCAGMTESLIGSQLFGHKRGAFTGAIADRCGVFEAANGGVIFLDEIGDLPLTMQSNLLRVLQEKEITRIGESTPIRVDVRVLAASHQNLDQLVQEGKFRQDLLYRIRVARITIPPLRERREDLPLLAEHFLSEAAHRSGRAKVALSDAALRILQQYDWPGNVRELQSAIESARIKCKGSVIRPEDLPPELNPLNSVLVAIKAARGNRAAAAEILGISRATLYRRLQELKVDPAALGD